MTKKTSQQAIFFDLDGTLIDTAPSFIKCLKMIAKEKEMPIASDKKIRHAVSRGTKGMLEAAFGIIPSDPNFNRLRAMFLYLYEKHMFEKTKLYEGIEVVWDKLDTLNIPWGIVTNKPTVLTNPLLTGLKIDKRPACIVCGDTTEQGKPAPDSIIYACEQIGFPPEKCSYVGDAESDVIAAKSANLAKTIVASYGYIADVKAIPDWGADHIIKHPSDLIQYL